jgi:hypothetical protein
VAGCRRARHRRKGAICRPEVDANTKRRHVLKRQTGLIPIHGKIPQRSGFLKKRQEFCIPLLFEFLFGYETQSC